MWSPQNLKRGLTNRLASITVMLFALMVCKNSIAQIRLPQIDPSGNRIFLPAPNSTTLLGPFHSGTGVERRGILGHHSSAPADGIPVPAAPVSSKGLGWGHGLGEVTPAFTHPSSSPSCNGPNCTAGKDGKHLIPKPLLPPKPGQAGEILMTPSRIVAPVGSEVVVLAGLCGGDGHFVLNQPLEWMLSNDSVGQIIEVGGMEHPNFNKFVPPSSKKFDGQYAWGRTGLKEKTVTRGTPTPVDDIDILKGQTYLSLSSASPGTSYLTAVAPKATGWDKRRATTVIHWVDGLWSVPLPVRTSSGTVQPLTTLVTRVADGTGIPGWKVRYSIIDGAPAEFVPTGSQQAEVDSNTEGQATVQVRQQAGKLEPGTTAIRVDVIRPAMLGEPELVVESGVTSVTWSSPALTIQVNGPESAALNQAFNYRVIVTNPGDQVARGVVVRTDDFSDDVKFISSNPKPAEYGNSLQWSLGDIAPGQQASTIDIQLKGDTRGMKRLCFNVESQTDKLATEACAETEVAAPCLGLQVSGNTQGVVGQQSTFNFDIVNQCDEPLENVVINVQYEPGLSAPGSPSPIYQNIGRLEFGERRSIPLIFDLVQPGVQCFVLSISADGGHTANAKRCIEVKQAALGSATLAVEGTRLAEVNGNVECRTRVFNTGNTVLKDITIVNKFSPSLNPTFFDGPATQTWAGNDVIFVINQLTPGQEAIIDVVYKAVDADGNAFTQFSMTQPLQLEDRLPIRIQAASGGQPGQPADPNLQNGIGIPADPTGSLSINVTSANPNIPADSQTRSRVEFTTKNNRNTSLRNVKFQIVVPPGLQMTGFESEGNLLPIVNRNEEGTLFVLETRREMRAGETLSFKADVVGLRSGQMPFQVWATSDDTLGTERGQTVINVTPQN